MSKRGANTYQIQQVMTSSPMMLVALLYDRAIQSLREAMQAIEAGDVQARWKANHRAFEIIQHLQMTLDLTRGGQIAENLDRLYGFILRRLPQVDMKNDPTPAEEAIKLLEPLRDSWRQGAMKGGAAGAASAETESAAPAMRTVVSA